MTVYGIAKWKDVFERAESRKLKQLTWIAMPVGFQSHGYQSLLDEFEGDAPAIYGAWCALVSLAASCAVRGVLANSRGIPLKTSHIARITGFPAPLFERLFAWASSEDVNWLEVVDPVTFTALESSDSSENGDNPRENDTSGKSPDDPPTLQGKSPSTQPNLTQPNLTIHNPTPPNLTQPGAADGRGLAGGNCFSVDGQEVMRQCLKLDKALIKVGVDAIEADDLWKLGWVSQQLSPGMLSEVATKVLSRDVKKPKSYIETALRRECSERGLALSSLIADAPERPKSKVAQ